MNATIDFWFDFASTYSYLSAVRIETFAAARNVSVNWRPFLLGPIFKAQGWATSPFNLFPEKGRYMIRDIERIAAERGVPFRMPEPFPQNSLLAARVAHAISEPRRRAAFCRAVFEAEFAHGRQISDATTLAACLTASDNPADRLEAAATDEVKAALRDATAEAQRLGIFGAPAFVTGGRELFWGDDRLEMALRWSQG